MTAAVATTDFDADASREELLSRSFLGLLITQFLGTLNDKMFQFLVIPLSMLVFTQAQALTLGTITFTVPFILFANRAGYLADRFCKPRVIFLCKVAEIVLMSLAVFGLAIGNVSLLFVIVMLMGTQSSLFGPSKYGCIPEIVREDRISAANGAMGLVSVTSAAGGAFLGSALYELNKATLDPLILQTEAVNLWDLWPVVVPLVGTAIIGTLTSMMIRPLPAAQPDKHFAKNPARETWQDLKYLAGQLGLFRAALGIAFFWMLASLVQNNIYLFGEFVFHADKIVIGWMLVILVFGLGFGSALAGALSRGQIELGLVPMGVLGIIAGSMFLCFEGSYITAVGNFEDIPSITLGEVSRYPSFWLSCFFLLVLGVGAGMFNIPLESFLQGRSDPQKRGTVIAAANLLAFSMMIVSAILFYVLKDVIDLTSSQIFFVAGLISVPVLIYIVWLLPYASVRFAVWVVSLAFYRLRIRGTENVPETGGALLVCNHVSRLDGPLLLMACPRPVRVIADRDFFQGRFLSGIAKAYNIIHLNPTMGPKGIITALKTAKEAVLNGEVVCIFPEGELTKTGQMAEFQRGMMRIIDGTDIPVVPVNLAGMWGSFFSYSQGFILKRKKKTTWPYPVTVRFGEPIQNPESPYQIRQAVQLLGVETVDTQPAQKRVIPVRRMIRRCRQNLSRVKVADSSGAELTGGKLLAGSLIMKRLLNRHVFQPDENMVGVLLPPTVAGTVFNAALALSRKVAVNLNYTLSEKDINHCIREAGLKHIITSRRFMEKLPFNLDAELIYAEDLKEKVTTLDKAIAASQAFAMPIFLLERLHGLTKIRNEDVLGIIFTSGSTGEPKGVMLSQNNVMSNIDSTDQLFHWKPSDSIMGIMPFFHSFGFTLSMWMTLTTDIRAVFHYNPIDARMIGQLCEKHQVSILMGTPTFLRAYLKRCTPEQMKHLELTVVGAEKLPRELAEEFEQKFGVFPTEGYGATELSPLASANVPNSRSGSVDQDGQKFGTVGRVIPGSAVRVVDPDTGEELHANTPGVLQFTGPNVMVGYLNHAEKTSEVVQDGWYNTGDMGTVDDAGFITLTGRLNRFSKIGGEMVPHVKIEEHLREIVKPDFPDDENLESALAVTAVPDDKKGEKLVVLHKAMPRSVDEVLKQFDEHDLPNLWRPARDCFVEVESVPILGTGKLDLKGIKDTALEKFAPKTEPQA